jgi:uncharacterized membrane protein
MSYTPDIKVQSHAMKATYNGKLAKFSLALCITILTVLNAKNFTTSYSLWLDELATAALFDRNHGGLWSYLMNDNFPPLYFSILKAWGGLFGTSETSLRMPSMLAAIGSMVTIGVFTLRYERGSWIWPSLAACLLGTLPTVAFSAQEARPYALMLLLATVTITSGSAVMRGQTSARAFFSENTFFASALLLSLSHYFGLILVLLAASANIILLDRSSKIKNLALIIVSLIWPIAHFLHGNILSGAGGNFWIQSEPIIGPLKTIIITIPFVLILLVTIAIRACFPPFAPKASVLPDKSIYFLSLIFTGFIGLMLISDFHTPLSIPRYYLVVAPVAALLLIEKLSLIEKFHSNSIVYKSILACLILVIILQGIKANRRVELKSTPDQNWKQLASIVIKSEVCNRGCDAIGYTTWGDYYFKGVLLKNFGNDVPVKLIHDKLKRPLLGFHRSASLISSLSKNNPHMICFEPLQSIRGSTFIFISNKEANRLQTNNLIPCLP